MKNIDNEILYFLLPFSLFYAIKEITRGYAILKHHIYSPSFLETIQNKMNSNSSITQGIPEVANQLITRQQKMGAYYSVFGGGLTIIMIIWVIYMLIKQY